MNGTENWDRPPSVFPLIRIAQRTQLPTSNRLGQGKRVASLKIDMMVHQRREPSHIFIPYLYALVA